MSLLITRLQKRYVAEGDELARDAARCISEMEQTINDLVRVVDPSEVKKRPAVRNAKALLRKLRGQ